MSDQTEAWCEILHDAYEAAAAEAGWETQQRSRKPWADVPEANKATMRAAVSVLAPYIAAQALRDAADAIKPGDHHCFKMMCPWCADRKTRESIQTQLRDRADRLVAS